MDANKLYIILLLVVVVSISNVSSQQGEIDEAYIFANVTVSTKYVVEESSPMGITSVSNYIHTNEIDEYLGFENKGYHCSLHGPPA